MKKLKGILLVSLGLLIASPTLAPAKQMITLMPEMMNQSEQIKAAEARRDAAQHQLRAAQGGWYPKLDLSADAGLEKTKKVDETTDSENRNYAFLRGTQLLTDFGATSGQVERAANVFERAKEDLENNRQDILLKGITAYVNVIRAREKLKYALQSEDNIKKQTGMEETLVEKKAGLSTDVLQTKAQLAGAQALRVSAEGELALANNRFKTIFKRFPTDSELNEFVLPKPAQKKIPVSLDEAIAHALDNNPQIRMAQYNIRIAEQDMRIQKTAYAPTLNLFSEATRREDDAAIEGVRNEGIVGVEFNYNLFKGGSDAARIKAATAGLTEANNTLIQTRDAVEEQVRNAWQNLITSKANYEYLQNQSDIGGEFLELARKERKLGTRSLLDVLTGEINYINSISKAVSADVDTLIAAYNLFFAMGDLNMDQI